MVPSTSPRHCWAPQPQPYSEEAAVEEPESWAGSRGPTTSSGRHLALGQTLQHAPQARARSKLYQRQVFHVGGRSCSKAACSGP
eukprot:5674806-Alexandrium_andersonii.AAC.1